MRYIDQSKNFIRCLSSKISAHNKFSIFLGRAVSKIACSFLPYKLDNICLNDDYSDEELQSALSDSGLLHFIEQVSNGLEYYVGENGNNLSGGQK